MEAEFVNGELVNGEELIIEQVADKKMTRNNIALTYSMLLRQAWNHSYNWKRINEAILTRWSLSGLDYIKRRAWKLLEAKRGGEA